jgi:hypothetical protein
MHQLDSAGYFVCDIVDEQGMLDGALWTKDPVIQPANRPQYVGGSIDHETGERSGGEWVDADQPSQEEQEQQAFSANQIRLTTLIQRRLDEIAAERGYDSILSLCSYATSSVPQFRAEGQAGVNIRDQCWVIGYAVLAEIAQGLRDWPADAEALAMMPSMQWSSSQ